MANPTPAKREASSSPPSHPAHLLQHSTDQLAVASQASTATRQTGHGNGVADRLDKAKPTPNPIAEVDVDADAGGFVKVMRKEDKRKLRKVEKHRPQFQFDVQQFRNGRKIGIAHIRDLVLYLVADGQKPGWIVPENRAFITHTVLVFIPGLLPSHLGLPPIPPSATLPFPTAPSASTLSSMPPGELPPNKLPTMARLFSYGVPTRAPGDSRRLFSVMGALMNSPLPDGVRRKKEEEGRKLAALAKADDVPPFLYLLTPNQMLDNDYKLPSYLATSDSIPIPAQAQADLPEEIRTILSERAAKGVMERGELEMVPSTDPLPVINGQADGLRSTASDGWVETPQAEGMPPDGKWRVLAIDCEMVLTEKGQELARISVIDTASNKNIFDELVAPSSPVVDYRTKWSGITPERLSTASHTLATIQSRLLDSSEPLITPHTILLGHSLECDLAALKLRHPLCIDTALIYRHPRGPPYKSALKFLAQKWLGREIQASEGGHDSEEDARTCVDLLKLKMANGPDFGSYIENSESIYERMSRSGADGAMHWKSSAACDYTSPRQGFSAKATTAVKCNGDDEVVKAMSELVETHDFVFGRMMELANIQGWSGEAYASPSSSEDILTTELQLDTALHKLDARLSALHAALPRNTALIIITGHSDPKPMLRLAARRTKWERLVKTLGGTEGVVGEERWLAEDDRELERVVGEAREGMAFFCVK